MIETPMTDRFSGGTGEGRVSAIEQEPIRRMDQPEDIADTVLWLRSDRVPSPQAPRSPSMAARRPDAAQHAKPTGLMKPVHNTKRRRLSNPRASIHPDHS